MELFKATITEKRKCASNVSTNIEDLPCKEFTAKNQQNQAFSLKIYQGDKLIYSSFINNFYRILLYKQKNFII